MANWIIRAKRVIANLTDSSEPDDNVYFDIVRSLVVHHRGEWVGLLNRAQAITGGVLQNAAINPSNHDDPLDIGVLVRQPDEQFTAFSEQQKKPYMALHCLRTLRRYIADSTGREVLKSQTMRASDNGKTLAQLAAEFESAKQQFIRTHLGDEENERET